jgi:hypothetical protein
MIRDKNVSRDGALNYRDSDFEPLPLPPALQRPLRAAAAAIAVVVFAVVLWVAAYVGLMFGWHPIPSTALGCSLHKRFHSFNGSPVKSENLGLATDCLKVTMLGREDIIRDTQKIATARAWLDARSDLWVENFLNAPEQVMPRIVIRACNQPGTSDSDSYVYLNDDWIGFNPSKRHQRPICRGEWREMAAIMSGSRGSH